MAGKPNRTAKKTPTLPSADMVIRGLAVLCALLALADFAIHRHAYFELEATPLFFAIMGASSMLLVAALSMLLRRLVIRPEDYYERQTENAKKGGGKNA